MASCISKRTVQVTTKMTQLGILVIAQIPSCQKGKDFDRLGRAVIVRPLLRRLLRIGLGSLYC